MSLIGPGKKIVDGKLVKDPGYRKPATKLSQYTIDAIGFCIWFPLVILFQCLFG